MATYAITDGGEASGSRAIKNPNDGSMVSLQLRQPMSPWSSF